MTYTANQQYQILVISGYINETCTPNEACEIALEFAPVDQEVLDYFNYNL